MIAHSRSDSSFRRDCILAPPRSLESPFGPIRNPVYEFVIYPLPLRASPRRRSGTLRSRASHVPP